MKHSGYNTVSSSLGNSLAKKIKYNGKELQDELGLNVYDYGNRNYNPAIGRFFNIDRFAEKYYDKTPYHYAANNPILFIDVQGDSIRVANIKDQGKILGMINNKTTGTFGFNKNGSLYLIKAGTNSGGSQYYNDRLIDAIGKKEDINISIRQTFKNYAKGGVIDDVDKDHGGGVTDNYENIKEYSSGKKEATKISDVTISGNSTDKAKDTFGKPLKQSPADILMHELVGHAIPWIVKPDTGNAVDNENKVRKELKEPKRVSDPIHSEL